MHQNPALQRLPFGSVIDAELKVLFEKLKEKEIANFALVGLVVVYGVPAHEEFQAQRCVLSPDFTSNFQVAFRYINPFQSTRSGATFQGDMALQEMYAVCHELKNISYHKGWWKADAHSAAPAASEADGGQFFLQSTPEHLYVGGARILWPGGMQSWPYR